MERAGEEGTKFPIEAIILGRLLKAVGANLCGKEREEEIVMVAFFYGGASDWLPVGEHRRKSGVIFAGGGWIFDEREETMKGHLVDLFFGEEKDLREEIEICLFDGRNALGEESS